MDTVSALDLSEIYSHYDRESRGYPPHHPLMMVALLLYAYCIGVPSSRKIEKRAYKDIAFRVLALDGTKLKANASQHKAMSSQRMNQEIAKLQAEVDKLLLSAEQVDAEEDRSYGPGRRGEELPQELRRPSKVPRCTRGARRSWSRSSARSRTEDSAACCSEESRRREGNGA